MTRQEFARQVLAAEDTLYHLSRSVLKNDEDCADAVQEAICTALNKLHTLRDDRYFKTWLCRILLNECYRLCRANGKVVPLEDYMLPEPSPEQPCPVDLSAAVLALRTDLRLPVVLHYIEGFQLGEIAEILKVPVGTVKSRLSRARTALRLALKEEEARYYE